MAGVHPWVGDTIADSRPSRPMISRPEGATPSGGKPWNTMGLFSVAPASKCLIEFTCSSLSRGTIHDKSLSGSTGRCLLPRIGLACERSVLCGFRPGCHCAHSLRRLGMDRC